MPDLSKFSDEVLRRELEKRQSKKKIISPIRSSKTDAEVVTSIINCLESCISASMRDGRWDEDNDVYILEAVIGAIYGDSFYEWKEENT